MYVSSIARLLNRLRTTIYKEIKYGITNQIKQNKKKIMYLADTYKAVYERNRKNSKKPFKILQSYYFIKYVQEKFYNDHWSLDSIYKIAKLDNLFNKTVCTKNLGLELLNIKVTDLPFKVKRNLKKSIVIKHKNNLGKSIELRSDNINTK